MFQFGQVIDGSAIFNHAGQQIQAFIHAFFSRLPGRQAGGRRQGQECTGFGPGTCVADGQQPWRRRQLGIAASSIGTQ